MGKARYWASRVYSWTALMHPRTGPRGVDAEGWYVWICSRCHQEGPSSWPGIVNIERLCCC